MTGNYILVSRTSIMETLDKIVYGPNVLKPKFTVNVVVKLFRDVKYSFIDHPWLSSGCTIGIAFGLLSWLRGRGRRTASLPIAMSSSSKGYFHRMTNSADNFKDGLLGAPNGSGTKAD